MRHSERQAFNSCPLRFHLEETGLKKISVAEEAEDRNFGIAMHEGLKVLHETRFKPESVELALVKFSDNYPADKNYKSKAKSHESGLSAIANYAEYWSVADENWELIGTEIAETVKFNGEEHDLHIDALFKNKQTGELWPWDHKCTEKFLGKKYHGRYELDSQITRYTFKILQKYGSCGGFYVNSIQVGHRQRMYKGEPAGYYQKFDRQPFNRDSRQIEYWKQSEAKWKLLIDFCRTKDVWPAHLSSLCSYCDYYELCMSGGDENTKESLYSKDEDREEVQIHDET